MPVNPQHLPRGVYLTADATAANLQRFQAYVGSGVVDTAEQAPFGLWWTFNPQSVLFVDSNSPGVVKTFIVPAARYSADTVEKPIAFLDTLHLGWDDRLEALGCTDEFASVQAGYLTASDMVRYTMTVNIFAQPCNRTPWAAQPGGPQQPLHSFTIPGVAAFGTVVRNNPLLLPVSIEVLPNTAYTVQVLVPGLYDSTGTGEQVMVPSLTIGLTGTTPVVNLLDSYYTRNTVQNLPVLYSAQQPSALTLTLPVAGQIIAADGASGVQTQLNRVEDRLLSDDRLYPSAQQGISSGLNADGKAEPVQSGYLQGWARQVIAVNLFENWNSVRASTVSTDLPFVVGPAPFVDSTGARACLPIPDNFVLDHVLLGCNWVSPPAAAFEPSYVMWGNRPSGPDFNIDVGVVIAAHGPTQVEQQVAYAQVTPATPIPNVVHSTFYTFPGGTIEAETLYEIPLVGSAVQPSWSQDGTCQPIYMGRTTNDAGPRQSISPAYATPSIQPVTDGKETHLWVKLVMSDLVDGLGDVALPDDVRIGSAGHTVYLIGYVPVQGAAGKAGNGRYAPQGEQGCHGGDKGG